MMDNQRVSMGTGPTTSREGKDKTTLNNSTYLKSKTVHVKDVDNSTSTQKTEKQTIISNSIINYKFTIWLEGKNPFIVN